MRELRIGSLLSLVRQGIELEVGYGTRSIEALLWVAETIEEGVYARGSLLRTPNGVAFRLTNPPLRVGAFSALRVAVDGRPVPTSMVRVRPGEGYPWREVAAISKVSPLELVPGRPTDVAMEHVPTADRLTVRLELDSVSIPPLVWVEFTDHVGEAP